MAKPTTITAWATNPGAQSDPGDARRATGFLAGRKLPAKWLNWLFAQNGAWFSYLQNLHIEPEFLNKIYTWAGAHAFLQSIGAYHSLMLGPGVEVNYANVAGVAEGRVRFRRIPIGLWNPAGSINTPPELVRNPPDLYWLTKSTGTIFIIPIIQAVPDDAEILSVRVGVYNASGSNRTINAQVVYSGPFILPNPAPSEQLITALGTSEAVAAPGTNLVLTVTGAGEGGSFGVIGSGHSDVCIRLSPGGADVRGYFAEVTYRQPGPR